MPLLSTASFPLSSLSLLGRAVRKQASEVLPQTSPFPFPSQFDEWPFSLPSSGVNTNLFYVKVVCIKQYLLLGVRLFLYIKSGLKGSQILASPTSPLFFLLPSCPSCYLSGLLTGVLINISPSNCISILCHRQAENARHSRSHQRIVKVRTTGYISLQS